MTFAEWNKCITHIKRCFMQREITRIDATYALEQLGTTPRRIAQLLRDWEDEHTMAGYTLTRSEADGKKGALCPEQRN